MINELERSIVLFKGVLCRCKERHKETQLSMTSILKMELLFLSLLNVDYHGKNLENKTKQNSRLIMSR